MEKIERVAIVASLRKENPSASSERVHLYADAFLEYQIAQGNITEHGSITLHPRTGAPIENPYVGARGRAVAAMAKCKLQTRQLWAAVWPEQKKAKP